MTILVTGAAGFIASNLCHHLISLGEEVVGIDALKTGSCLDNIDDIGSDKFCFHVVNLCNYEYLKGVFQGRTFDQVYHLAAESHVDRSIAGDLPFWESNVIGTRNLLDCCREFGVNRILNQITDEVYGPKRKGVSFESDVFLPTSPYAASKAAQYYVGRSYHQTHNLPVVSTFPANTYGPRQYPEKLVPKFIGKLLAGDRVPLMASVHFQRDWLAVTDHIEALVHIMKHGVIGEGYNVPGTGCVTNETITRMLLEYTDRLWESSVDLIEDRKAHDCRYCVDGHKLATLGWQPTNKLADYLPVVVEWYKQNARSEE